MNLLLLALAIIAGSGVLALLDSRHPARASAIGAYGAVAGCATGLAATFPLLAGGEIVHLPFAGEVLFGGRLVAGVDPLSAFFLVPVFVLGAFTALYGRGYLAPFAGKKPLGVTWLAFNLLLSALAAVLLARDALSFLFAWELMSLSAFVLVSFEHERPETRRAGFVYLIASHVAMAALIALFLLFARHAGSLELEVMQASRPPAGLATALFLLALLGFGTKAGFVPLHVWLPEAHAAAPSHVSALMSGVLIELGVYGVVRVVLLLGAPAPWWGPLLIAIGLAGGLIGIAVALYQRDLKRVLAYSSVENVGVIALGLGVALWAKHAGEPRIAALGLAGALFHTWSHALIKALLFLAAGAVVHGAGTKDLARLGGLMKRMPRTGAAMMFGAVAIAALPPLNGFIGEWLIYLGLADAGLARAGTAIGVVALLAVGLFAFTGALAVLCFVRLAGIALLGEPRSSDAAHAHEAPASMFVPMAALAGLCLALATTPAATVALLDRVAAQLLGDAGGLVAATGAPLAGLGAIDAAVIAAITAVALLLRALLRRNGATAAPTWDCGYAAPAARMQYVPGSFSELFAEHLLPRVLRARIRRSSGRAILHPETQLAADAADPLTRGAYEPVLSLLADRLARLRWLQAGSVHIYLFYILLVVVAGLAWMTVRSWFQGG